MSSSAPSLSISSIRPPSKRSSREKLRSLKHAPGVRLKQCFSVDGRHSFLLRERAMCFSFSHLPSSEMHLSRLFSSDLSSSHSFLSHPFSSYLFSSRLFSRLLFPVFMQLLARSVPFLVSGFAKQSVYGVPFFNSKLLTDKISLVSHSELSRSVAEPLPPERHRLGVILVATLNFFARE